ncbi:DUF2975 domain-containing protein [Asticcacaulis sp. AC402]|uniref:DUF2975 domain-containing protein n=1 Tax=Asticcacaulis sp. AC402 TaxID=1282361 RepID=UPI0003C3DF80|nr:DUF2975 domain-containing protein [Asticcacaulis sp. AC402]ESQ77420.1 hypothetical protein ABAC402_01385 [Asticcacaulis sp. AC402]
MTQQNFRSYSVATSVIMGGLIVCPLLQRLLEITRELPPEPGVFEGPFWWALVSPAYWLGQVPTLFYIAALWPAARVFRELDSGKPFSAAAARALNGIGTCLCLGGLSAITFVPYGVSLLSGQPKATDISIHILPLVLIVVGLVMSALGRVGAKLQAELEDFV